MPKQKRKLTHGQYFTVRTKVVEDYGHVMKLNISIPNLAEAYTKLLGFPISASSIMQICNDEGIEPMRVKKKVYGDDDMSKIILELYQRIEKLENRVNELEGSERARIVGHVDLNQSGIRGN